METEAKGKKTSCAKRMKLKLHGSGYSRHLHQAVIREETECEQS